MKPIRLGILGGGQLGRMLVLAAAPLGIRCHIYSDAGADCPAAQICTQVTLAQYDDKAALAQFASSVDVITYEFENIPAQTVKILQSLHQATIYPSLAILATTQHRIREKKFINDCGIGTAIWRGVSTWEDVSALRQQWHEKYPGRDLILKTAQMGYDGKGQVKIPALTNMSQANAAQAEQLWQELSQFQRKSSDKLIPKIGENNLALDTKDADIHLPQFIAELCVDFIAEASVIIARNQAGESRSYPLVENRHRDHILSTTLLPINSNIAPPALAHRAQEIAEILAHRLDLVGILAVELFITKDQQILVNELAPRPHNSGHWSLDFCVTSQFEQTIRAVCGLPLGAVDLRCPMGFNPQTQNIVMQNLLGEDAVNWRDILADPYAKLHLYGKTDPVPGRKMGHVTRLVAK